MEEKRGGTMVWGERRGERGVHVSLSPPALSRISITSQAEAEDALESVESEALSLIESHASVTCKALQSRKDLGAAEPQTSSLHGDPTSPFLRLSPTNTV